MKGNKEIEGKREGELFKAEPALKKMKGYAMLAAVGWTILLSGLLAWDIVSVHRNTEELAINEARANFNKDQAFRYWGGSHGGVYVPVDENTPPSPYLKHIPERDIMTPSGKKLTLMNPAYMVRQMNELFTKEYGVVGHITSLKLHNPDNVPDDWERKALEAFERGEKEILEFSDIDGAPYIRLMQPMMTKEGCLKCHAYQGYKVGDVRGGVSVSMSISGLLAERNEKILDQCLSHGLIWLMGFIGIFIGYGKTRRYLLELTEAEEKQREAEERATALLNATLESLILIDLEGNVLAINQTGANRLNATQEHLLGKNIFDFMSTEVVESRRKLISEILSTRKGVTFEDHRENRDFHTNLVPVQNGGVHAIAIFAQDITERKLADMAIRESEEKYRRLVENLRKEYFFYSHGTDGVFTYLSPSITNVLGYEHDEFLKHYTEYLTDNPKNEEVVRYTELSFKGEQQPPYEIEIYHKDRSVHVLEVAEIPVLDDEGKVIALEGLAHDITERKNIYRQLKLEKEFTDNAVNAQTDTFFLFDISSGKALRWNSAFRDSSGYSDEEISAMKAPDDWYDAEDLARAGDILGKIIKDGQGKLELSLVTKDGRRIPTEYNASVIRDEKGLPKQVISIGRDITERKKAESKLIESEERLNRGQEVGHVGTWDWNPNTGKLIWSDETYRIHGFAPGEVEPTYELFLEMVHPDDRESLSKAVERALSEKASYNVDCRILRKDGIKRITNATGKVVFDEEGKSAHMLGTFQDITERKRIEETLYFIAQQGWEAGGENFFEALVTYLAETLNVDYSLVGKIIDNEAVRTVALYANGKIEENMEYGLKGTPCEDVVGKEFCCYPENIQELFPKDEMLVPMEAESYVGIPIWDSRGKSMGLIAVLSKKNMREVESVKALLQLVAIRAAYEMERSIIDEELRKSEGMLKEAQKLTHMGHWDLDLGSNKLYWSEEIFRIFEVEKGKYEPSYDAFLDIIHPDDREFVNKTYTESVKVREPYDIAHRLLMKDGTLKYVNEKCRTEYDDNGNPLRSIGTVQDITAAKEAELELGKAKEAAEEASRAKTDFLSRMSHELRTPLNSILGFAQIIQSEVGEMDVKQGMCLDEIISAGWHLTDLVNEVLDVSRIESGKLSLKLGPVDICPIMEECINLVTPLAEGKNIKVSCNLKVCNKETVWGDKTRLKEVFLNLLSNAIKYNIDSGAVIISCKKMDEKSLLISLVDSGKGVSEEDQKLLFMPFSRIKGEDPAIQGTGIGLAISKHLVELMGGEIGVESAPGKGSTFWVKLQITEDAAS